MRGRRGVMHRLDDALVILRLGDRENVGEFVENRRDRRPCSRSRPPCRSPSSRPDGLKRLGLGAVEEAAGVDDDDIGAGVGFCKLITLGAQPVTMRSLSTSALGQPRRRKKRAARDFRKTTWRRSATSPCRWQTGPLSIRRGNAGRSDGRVASESRSRLCRRARPAHRPRSSRPEARRNRRAARSRAAHR